MAFVAEEVFAFRLGLLNEKIPLHFSLVVLEIAASLHICVLIIVHLGDSGQSFVRQHVVGNASERHKFLPCWHGHVHPSETVGCCSLVVM